jgi:hypothetical protein
MTGHTHVRRLQLQAHYGDKPVDCMVELEIDLDAIAQRLGATNRNAQTRCTASSALSYAAAVAFSDNNPQALGPSYGLPA